MKTFNFRHVMDRLGIPQTSQANWKMGHVLRRWASEAGIEPDRKLTEKTNPNPKVRAPHCICAYPLDRIDDAIAYARDSKDGGAGQTQLDLSP
jgi:hypothetical protein